MYLRQHFVPKLNINAIRRENLSVFIIECKILEENGLRWPCQQITQLWTGGLGFDAHLVQFLLCSHTNYTSDSTKPWKSPPSWWMKIMMACLRTIVNI